MNTEEQRLNATLRSIARGDGEEGAPPHVKAALVAAFRGREAGRKKLMRRRWALGSAEAMIAAVIAFRQAPQRAPEPGPSVVAESQEDSGADFVPFLEGDNLEGMESGQVVRVRLSIAALADFGFPIAEESFAAPVNADLLLGEDGMARAIRVVN